MLNPKNLLDTKKLRIMDEDEIVHKSENEAFLKQIAEFVLKLDKRQEQEIQTLRQAVSQLMTKIEGNLDISLTDLKSKVDSLFVGDRVKKLEYDHDQRMKGVDERMSKVKDGKHGRDGRDGKPGKDGRLIEPNELVDKINKAESKITSEQITGLPELIKKVDLATKLEAKRIIAPPHNLLQTFSVSSQADGSNRTFTGLPTARFYPFVALSGQNPVMLIAGTHYTVGNKQIVISNNVEAPQSGVEVTVFFIK